MPESTTIAITLNGDAFTIAGQRGLAALLEHLKMKPSRVAVEINGAIVPKASYASTVIHAGDSVEIINFVGGG